MGGILAAAGSLFGKAVASTVSSSLFAGLSGNSKDAGRIAQADSSLRQALDGDAYQLGFIIGQAANSATSVGKEAYRRALAYYNSAAGTSYQPGAVAPKQISPVQRAVETFGNAVRDAAGNLVQTVGTGAVNAANTAVSAPNSNQANTKSVPISPTQLAIGGGVLIAVLFGLKRRHA
jgi:hypothetical protein